MKVQLCPEFDSRSQHEVVGKYFIGKNHYGMKILVKTLTFSLREVSTEGKVLMRANDLEPKFLTIRVEV